MIEKLNIIAKALNERSGRGGTGSASITDVTYAGQLNPNENSGIIARAGDKIYMPVKSDADGYKVIFNKNKSTSQQCDSYINNDISEQLPGCASSSRGENRAYFNEFSNKTWYACRGSENDHTDIGIYLKPDIIESCSKIKFLVSNFFSINNVTNLIPADYHSTIIKLLVDGNEVDSVEFPHITKGASIDDIAFQYLTFDAAELTHTYHFEFIVEDLEPDGDKAEARFNIFEMVIEKEGAEGTFSWSEVAHKTDTKKDLNDLKADVKAETSDIRSEITTTNERIEEVDKRIEDTRILSFDTLPDPGEIYLDRVIKVGATLYLCKKTGEGVTKFYPFDDFVARTSEYTDHIQFSKTIGNNFYTDFEATANYEFAKVFPDDGGFHLGSSKVAGAVTFVPKHQFDMPVTKFCAYVQSWSDTKNSGVGYGYDDAIGGHVFDGQKTITPGEVYKIEIQGFGNFENNPRYSFHSIRPDKIGNVSGDFRIKFVNGFEVTFGETTYEWIPVGSSKLLEVTYEELKNLRDNSKLIPGQQYRITDYETITAQEGTKSAGHRFDIIVTADSENTLNENARAISHNGDEYFANSNLAAWELKYCLDNDTDRFSWVIKRDIDREYVILEQVPIDCETKYNTWIGTKFYRYPELDYLNDSSSVYTAKGAWLHESDTLENNTIRVIFAGNIVNENIDDKFSLTAVFYKTSDGGWELDSTYGDQVNTSENYIDPQSKGAIYYMKDEWGNECPYDFKNIMFQRYFDEGDQCYKYNPTSSTNRWCYTFCMWDFYDNQPHDLSVDQFKYKNDDPWGIANTKNNIIKSNTDINLSTNKQVIANIAFVTNTNISEIPSDYVNGSFYGFYNNKISGESSNVTFGGCSILNNIIANVKNNNMDDIKNCNINVVDGVYINGAISEFWFNNQKRF